MDCSEFQALLADHLAGELGASQTEAMLDHLNGCEACRGEFQAYQEQEELLKRYFKRQLNRASKTQTVVPELPSKVIERRRSRLWLGLGAVAAAAAIVVLAYGAWSLARRNGATGAAVLAEVREAEGHVLAISPTGLVPLRPGDPVGPAQKVKVASGGYVALTLAKGNVLEARGGSQFSLCDFPDRSEVVMNRGQVWAHLNARPDKPFVIKTPHLTALAKGTVYGALESLDRSLVSVARGAVVVESGGVETVLTAGGEYCSSSEGFVGQTQDLVGWSHYQEDLAGLTSGGPSPAPAQVPALQVQTAASADSAAALADSVSGIDDLLDLLPETTRYFLDFRDWPEILAAFRSSDYSKLTQEPSFRQWWEALQKEASLTKFAAETHLREIADIAQRVDGQFVVGIVPNKGFLLLADCKEHEQDVRLLLDTIVFDVCSGAASRPAGAEAPSPAETEQTYRKQLEERLFVTEGRLILSNSPELAREAVNRLVPPSPSGFRKSDFYQSLMRNVENPRLMIGANLMDLMAEQLGNNTDEETWRVCNFFGWPGLDYLLISPNFAGRGMNQAARLGFIEKGRYGALNWLAEPAPMRGMDFFSPDVHFFASAILRDPVHVLADFILAWDTPAMARPREDLQTIVGEYGAWLGSFGGEVAVGVDNPILPVPNIKVAVELVDQAQFELGLHRLLQEFVQQCAAAGKAASIEETAYRGRTIHSLVAPELVIAPSFAVVGDFCVAGPGPQFVCDSIDVYESGRSITRDSRLISLLPEQTEANFSFLAYQDIARAIPELVRSRLAPLATKTNLDLVPDLDFMQRYRAAGIAYVYARPTCMDVYLKTPAGIDFNVGMAAPLVANWILPRIGADGVANGGAAQ